jgi:hypothetical protein
MMSNALDFALHRSRCLDIPCTAHAVFPERCLIIARVSVSLSPRFAHKLMLFLRRIYEYNEMAPGEIYDSK